MRNNNDYLRWHAETINSLPILPVRVISIYTQVMDFFNSGKFSSLGFSLVDPPGDGYPRATEDKEDL
jgi:hypothetical protein